MKNNRVFFPNLDGLRFIAALMVLMPHIEQIKSLLNLEYSYKFYPVEFGKLGVALFFVLSGYLITYLLLVEEDIYKNISIKKFYLRRIFRIWPLYYLVVLLSFFVFPHISFLDIGMYNEQNLSDKNIILYLLFLPNIAIGVPFISQTWSIGVEEQFYLIWPVLMKYIKNKYILFISVFLAYFAILLLLEKFSIYPKIQALLYWFKIDCMAIGGFFALLLFNKSNLLLLLYSKSVQIITYCLILGLLITKTFIQIIHFEVFSILFGIVILNLSSNEKTILNIEGKLINYLGRISYGIYMYHVIAIVIVLKLLVFLNISNILLQYLLSIILTIVISSISYTFFEKYFINIKRKFSRVTSGEDTKKN
ncbi:putative acyltransferase [Bernardetia litoralis DSM 6794]|uniref:Putative acyltransferase n=1 Tax=Bernardetia litoralis (strain ATCC 23117 / DSM 6794 / NBRC 15988 / NCIMB 1366 / Fx l1 / Sio-4) TaxID=880071 RepID=I4AIE7_BERLS|nr:acyltransferase [Bernardetia litoralis]AFM03732.1 putative acyltransferase [Bernardetia litoralis DSM 6794]